MQISDYTSKSIVSPIVPRIDNKHRKSAMNS